MIDLAIAVFLVLSLVSMAVAVFFLVLALWTVTKPLTGGRR